MIAYFDANPIDHCVRREAGVTAEMVQRLQCAIRDGRLTVPASMITTEELLSTTLRDPEYASQVGGFYLRLASLNRVLKQPRDLLYEAIGAYARRAAEPTRYMPLARRTRQAWENIASGHGDPADVRQIVGEVQQDVDHFNDFMLARWEDNQDAVRQARREARRLRQPRPMLTRALFDRHAREYAEGFARRSGTLRACRRRGIAGLLSRPRVLAAAGGAVVLVWRQVTEGLRPDRGDSRDLQHLLMASASSGVLVTHDRRLRILAERVPGLELRVMSVPALVDELDQSR